MMKAQGHFSFEIPQQGNVGHNNKSELILTFKNLGKIQVSEEWNLGNLNWKTLNLEQLYLSIPTGELIISTISSVSKTKEEIIISGFGNWTGSYNGLNGGMSSYGNFATDFTVSKVTGGRFIPSHQLGMDHPTITQYRNAVEAFSVLFPKENLDDRKTEERIPLLRYLYSQEAWDKASKILNEKRKNYKLREKRRRIFFA